MEADELGRCRDGRCAVGPTGRGRRDSDRGLDEEVGEEDTLLKAERKSNLPNLPGQPGIGHQGTRVRGHAIASWKGVRLEDDDW